MQEYVDLQRRFKALTKEELEHPERLSIMSDYGHGGGMAWSELLKYHRVVVLAEAGSGKTREFKEQVRKLTAQGECAIFAPLEYLDKEPVDGVLSNGEKARLDQWRNSPTAPGWFFLDAVDELQLTRGKLDRALMRLSMSIDGCLERARIVLSCRPSDWHWETDLITLRSHIPVAEPSPNICVSQEEEFLRPLTEKQDRPGDQNEGEDRKYREHCITHLLPLGERQIRKFVEHAGIQDTTDFMAEMSRRDALQFARRPFDLIELLAYWKANGRIGTLTELHEFNIITKLKENPERPAQDQLTDQRAREGAERLALALALTRNRTIKCPEQSIGADLSGDVLDATEVAR